MAASARPLPDRFPLPFDPTMPPAERCRLLAATFPKPLQEVLAAGRVERRPRFRDDAFDGLSETWLPPTTAIDSFHATLAQRALDELERTVLAPAEPSRVLGRVLALLSHFPAKGLTPDVEQMVALDWAEDLGEFPGWAIDHAARTWRRSRKWRPSIAEMRALCEDACTQERRMAERLRAIARAGSAGAAAGPVTLLRLAGTAVRRFS